MTLSPSAFEEIAPVECERDSAVFQIAIDCTYRSFARIRTCQSACSRILGRYVSYISPIYPLPLSSISDKLRGSKFGDPPDVDHMTECFDKSTKLTFRNSEEPSYIRFGTARDRDLSFDIRSGQMKLPGCVFLLYDYYSPLNIKSSAEVAKLFEPSIEAIIEAIAKQRQAASMPVKVSP
jgi:hypothetical protein